MTTKLYPSEFVVFGVYSLCLWMFSIMIDSIRFLLWFVFLLCLLNPLAYVFRVEKVSQSHHYFDVPCK
ncbi:hypothetical protein SLEP1_g2423 [Rubroshorea leprosula]|uniref:Uncharacterized protein n=1 Tax=Rubroshorea leprosula TaxID=152421 RepID=A0AAV5HNQ5_9ROSI|nr:hypothetical protein SLEP1_g2423 [Rubroshorea leprosula]